MNLIRHFIVLRGAPFVFSAAALVAAGCNTAAEKPDPAPTAPPETAVEAENGNAQLEAVVEAPVAGEKPTEEKPTEEKPTEEKPTEEKPTEEKPADVEKPVEKMIDVKDESLNKDGIDDENPLPKAGTLRSNFDKAATLAISDPKAAVAGFEAAAKENDYFYAAWFNAGVSAERSKNDVKAEAFYKKALEIRPDYGPALVNLYNLYFRQGKKTQGDKLVDSALEKQGRRAGPHLAAANRAFRNGDVSETEKEALATIRISERTVEAMRLMGWVFSQQKRYETAKFALANALILEPGNALLLLDIGFVYLALDDEKAAMSSFGKAALMRPEMAEAHERYGLLQTRFGDGEGAFHSFAKAAALQPKSSVAQLHLGNGYRLVKKYKEAEEAYKKALSFDAALHSAHFNLGVMYMDNEIAERDKLEQMEQAKKEFEIFAEKGTMSDALKPRITDYLKTLERRIKREKKRRKRRTERKAIEVEEKKKEEAAAKEKEAAAKEKEAAAKEKEAAAKEKEAAAKEKEAAAKEKEAAAKEKEAADAKTPEDGTKKPEDGTKTPEDGTKTPEDGTKTPEDGTKKPEDGTKKPEDGTKKPEDGTKTPEDGTKTPEDGTKKPEDGGNPQDGASVKDGEAVPEKAEDPASSAEGEIK
ncbi:MAG: hypothetical protein GY822_23965 [Deltaproteobacteria bacterium]|nr:hypothetical protein [Deltaproteobacteria bacterium]